jgi:hypothetical protein
LLCAVIVGRLQDRRRGLSFLIDEWRWWKCRQEPCARKELLGRYAIHTDRRADSNRSASILQTTFLYSSCQSHTQGKQHGRELAQQWVCLHPISASSLSCATTGHLLSQAAVEGYNGNPPEAHSTYQEKKPAVISHENLNLVGKHKRLERQQVRFRPC